MQKEEKNLKDFEASGQGGVLSKSTSLVPSLSSQGELNMNAIHVINERSCIGVKFIQQFE